MNAQYAVPVRAAAPRPRRSHARRRAQVHPARGVAGAGQGLRPGAVGVCIGGDRAVGLPAREGAAVPHARRRESRSAAGGARSVDHGRPSTRSASARWASAARRRSSAARSARSTGCRRASSCRSRTTAGRSAGSASCSTRRPARSRGGSTAIRRIRSLPMIDQAGFARTGREVVLHDAAHRGAGPRAQGRRRRAGLGPDVHRPRRRARAPDEARRRRSICAAASSTTAVRSSLKDGDGWRVTAAGPTTSIREEPYQGDIIKRYGVRAVIGKGGMGAKTLAGAEGARRGLPERHRRRGAVLRAVRSRRSTACRCSSSARPRRCGTSTVDDFPAIVTMDAHGNSLHKDIEQESARQLATMD